MPPTLQLRCTLHHSLAGEFNNHRLAWLGDAVMTAVVSELVFRALPEPADTEALHEWRKAAVGRGACAGFAAALGLDQLLVVGAGYDGQEPSLHMLAGG